MIFTFISLTQTIYAKGMLINSGRKKKKKYPRVAFDTFGCTWPNTLKHFWCNILSSFTKCYATVWAKTWSWIQLISNLLLPCYYTNNCILIIFYSTYPMISPLITWSCYTLENPVLYPKENPVSHFVWLLCCNV